MQHKPWEAAPNFNQCLIKMVHKCELWFVIFQFCFWANRIQKKIQIHEYRKVRRGKFTAILKTTESNCRNASSDLAVYLKVLPALSSLWWGFQWFCWKRTRVGGWVGTAAPRRHTDFPTEAPHCLTFHWSLPHRMSAAHMLYLNTCNEDRESTWCKGNTVTLWKNAAPFFFFFF